MDPRLPTLASYLTIRNVIAILLPAYLIFWIGVYIYRITLHPLAKFPGPKLAAASFWYEFYYDLWPHRYRYLWKIEELHKKYGPIVRINPIHIHIRDPDYLDEIYAGGRRKRDRDSWYMHASDSGMLGWSILQTMDHDTHRMRRAALNPFFSKRTIQQLEDVIVEKIHRLTERIAAAHRAGEVLNLTYATAALTMDVISGYALGAEMGNLERDDWGGEWFDAFRSFGKIRPIGRQFKTYTNWSLNNDPRIVRWVNPMAANIVEKLSYPMGIVQAALQASQTSEKNDDDDHRVSTGGSRKTIFQDIVNSNLPPSEKTLGRLNAEAGLALGAGTETTSRNLTVLIYYLFANPTDLSRLREELKTVMPRPDTPVKLADLEALPFMSACITEGLRMAHGGSSRMPRVATEEDLVYHEWVIPKGTPVMQSMYLHHMNPDIFPEPEKFLPQRWIDDPKLKPRYFWGFGRGSRSCVGMNLATAELYLSVAKVLSRFDIVPYEVVKERDVDVSGDCFIGITSDQSPGVRVRVTKDYLDE